MKKILVLFIIVLSIPLSAHIIDNAFTPSLLMPTFLNPDKITINHTVSFSGGISSNDQSYYQSVYTNHIAYQFTPKLSLKVDLNFVNYGTATYQQGIEFEGNNDNTSRVLPNMQINWKPTENTSVTIEFKQYHNPLDYYRRW